MTKKRINQLTKEAMRQEISYEAKLFKSNILLLKVTIFLCVIVIGLTIAVSVTSFNRQKRLSPNGIYLEKLEEASKKGQIEWK